MDEKKDFLDSFARTLMLATIVIGACCTLIGFFCQFASADLEVTFNQLSFYMYGWAIFLALGPSVKRGMFMKIDVIVGLYPESLQKVLKTVTSVLMFVLIALMFAYSIPNLMDVVSAGSMNESAPSIPLALAYAAPVVGFGLGVIAYIVKVISGKGEK